MASGTAITALFLLPIALLSPQSFFPTTAASRAVLTDLARVTRISGQGLIAYAFAHLPVSLSSLRLLMQPLTASIVACALFGVAMGSLQSAADALVPTDIGLARRDGRNHGRCVFRAAGLGAVAFSRKMWLNCARSWAFVCNLRQTLFGPRAQHGGTPGPCPRRTSARAAVPLLRCLVPDGVYRAADRVGRSSISCARPTGEPRQALLTRIIKRLTRSSTRQGYLIEAQGMTNLDVPDPERALAPPQAAACTCRVAFGPRAGQEAPALHTAANPTARSTQQRGVNAPRLDTPEICPEPAEGCGPCEQGTRSKM